MAYDAPQAQDRVKRTMGRLGSDDRGTILALFARVSIIVLALTGAVVDFGLAWVSKPQLSRAVDAGVSSWVHACCARRQARRRHRRLRSRKRTESHPLAARMWTELQTRVSQREAPISRRMRVNWRLSSIRSHRIYW